MNTNFNDGRVISDSRSDAVLMLAALPVIAFVRPLNNRTQ